MQALETEPMTRLPHIRETHSSDGAVLLDPVRGKCYSLDPVSAFIWQHLGEGCAPIQIAEKVSDTCNISLSVAKADVIEFVQSLVDAGLVFRQNAAALPPVGLFTTLLNRLGLRVRNQ